MTKAVQPGGAESLHRATERMKQIAAAHAPAFIELVRGQYAGTIKSDRPGLVAVTRLMTAVLLGEVRQRVLLDALVEAGGTTYEAFEADLAAAVELENAAMAEAINGGSVGLLQNFAFAPVADAPPKEKL